MANEPRATIKVGADFREAERSGDKFVSRLEKRLRDLNKQALGGKVDLPFGIDEKALANYKKAAEQIKQVNVIRARNEAKLAEETARQISKTKQSELRRFENAERSKHRLAEISAKSQAKEAELAAKAVENAKRREFQEYQRLEREKTRVAQTEARKRVSLSDVGKGLKSAGQGVQNFGLATTAVVTAPILGLGKQAVDSALEFNKLENTLTALLGSSDKAKAKIRELVQVSKDSVGVTIKGSIETYNQLKGIGELTDETITRQIQALGKLKTAFKIDDLGGFNQNLVQIFQQGFERSDIKEAIGRVPIFEQLLEQAFGTKDGAKLKALKESGKLTMDSFLQGLSGAIENDPRLVNIGEDIGTRFEKLKERVLYALVPLGEAILNIFGKILPFVLPLIEQISSAFSSLSPATQTLIVIFGAIAAALGPVLLLIGTLTVAIGAFISTIAAAAAAVGGFAALAGIIVGVILQIGAPLVALGVAVYALYQIWESNFGNIQAIVVEFQALVTESFNSLITVVQPAIDEIVLFATDGFNQIKLWWAENGAEISQAVEKVLRFILQIVQIQLGHIKQLWAEYGEQITAIVSATWNIVKTIITTAVQIIGNAIKLVAAIINGDWAKAWEAFKSILSVGINSGIAILKSFITITSNIFFGIVKIIYNIGRDIVVGLINGIKSKIAEANATAHDLVSGIITVMRAVPIIRSPSKVTTEIGENIGEGLAAGLENKTGRVRSAAKKIADETIKTLADAVKEFEKVSGLNPAQIARTNQADDYRQGANDLREIIKLRKELGVDQFEPLPDSPGAASAVLQGLQNKKQAADDYAKSLDELRESFEKLQESIIAEQKAFDDRKTGIIENGEINLIQLQKEIALLGVTDELEKIRIQNSFELQSLRVEMTNDGYGQQQVQEILDITEAEQNQLLELQQILRVRKEVLEASNLGNELNEKLLNVQNGGRELSEYEQTLRRLNEDFKNISPQQREQLLNTAAQIDAQKQFNEEYQQTYDFIRGAFDILTERGKSFGEKMKTIFAGILNSFKNMLLNMTSQFLTSKLFGGRQSGGGGFSLGNIFGGGGIGGTPPFNPNFAFAGGGGAGGFGGFASLLSQTPISPLSTSGTLESTIGLRGGGTYTSGLGNIGQTATSNLSSYSQFKQLFGGAGLVGGIAGALPLLGASLGSLVGGQSTGGQILGSLGGLAGGLAGSALLAPTAFAGIFGAAAPLLATVSLIAAPALLIGAYLLKRNAARRRDETTRDALMVDTLKQLNEIKAEMEAARPGINVKGLLDETGQISANYFTQANQLKDKKTRNIAIKDGNERVGIVPPNSAYPNALTNQIYALSDAAKLKEEIRAAAYERDRRILPEFASGGFIPKLATGDYFKPNGLVPGVFDRKDDILALISRGEMVLNPMQQQKIRAISGFDVFSYAGIPNYQQQQQPRMPKFAEGGNLSQSNSSVKTPDFQFNFNGNIVLEGFIAEPDAKAYLETPDGKQQVINIVDKGYDSRRLKLGRK